MTKTLLLATAITTALAGATMASDDAYKYGEGKYGDTKRHESGSSETARLSDDALRAKLQQQGYKVIKVERERDEIEVYAEKDGQLWELELDKTGRLLEAERKN